MAEEAGMVHAELDPESLRKVIRMAKEASPVLRRNVYARIRDAAEPAADAARNAILAAPVGEGKATWRPSRAFTKSGKIVRKVEQANPRNTVLRHTGLRAGIASGVKVGLGSGAFTMGVKITAGAGNLRADQYRMPRTYDKPEFRHPVFGHGSVPQKGLEWFYGPIEKTRPTIARGVQEAMDKAAEELA